MADANIALPSNRIKDMRGKTFGRLRVTAFSHLCVRTRNAMWNCECTCGNATIVSTGELNRRTRDGVRSCGCLQPDTAKIVHTKHGHASGRCTSAEYRAWTDMIARCGNPRAQEWARYGARGISVCVRWRDSFEAFLSDVGPKPHAGLTLDRIDSNGNYEPGNVRWADRKTQQRNRRVTRFVTFRGERLPMTELAERFGLTRHQLAGRLKKGLTSEQAVAYQN